MQTGTKIARRDATAASGDDVAILAFTGDIASTSKEAILQAYHGAGAVKKVLLDFSGVDYINSSGIAIIIQMLLEERTAGHRTIGIFGLTPHFKKVFTMVGVAKYASISPDQAAALSAM
ncbi:MAG TPA: STAS domain-containing protein [Acidobacteriaceae bacterium]|nr:STAS domain-containing protein [Acidobacteriaceae bacterium]